jgi:predicted metal-dependent peptidase
MSATSTANRNDAKRFADLVGPTDPKVDREVREILVTARIGMLLRASFFGNLATRLKLVNADEWCSTAATDGRNFYYNTRFIKMLRPKEVEFLFGHEVLHCVYDHFGRRGDRDHRVWNIANDYCVNSDLKKHRVGEFITSVPCLFDTKYDGKSSEEVYDMLMENATKINLQDLLSKILDDHLDGKNGDSNGDGDSDGDVLRPTLTEEERQAIRDEFKEAVLSAAQTCGANDLPAGVKRMIKDLTEPQMNWRELLRMQLESTIKSDYTWMRASRRGWHMDAIMPGQGRAETIDIAVAIDTSGSISKKQATEFLSEIKGIMEAFDTYKIHVFTFDTNTYNPQQFDSDNLADIADYDVQGDGGTDFTAIFKYLKDENIEPERLVVFTDGYPCGSWGDSNYCDTVWIIHGDKNPNPPFGVFALYEENKK